VAPRRVERDEPESQPEDSLSESEGSQDQPVAPVHPQPVPVPPAADDEDDTAADPAEDPADDMPLETVTVAALKNWTSGKVVDMDIRWLRWDRQQKWGQIRPLNTARVNRYVEQLKCNPPRVPLKILVKHMGRGV